MFGNEKFEPKNSPEALAGVVCEIYHGCAWSHSGNAYCWGKNADGQVGIGTRTSTDALSRLTRINHIIEMSVAPHSSCALGKEGAVWCWGNDIRLSPKRVEGLPPIVQIAGGGADLYCGLDAEGGVWRWRTGKPIRLSIPKRLRDLGGCGTLICGRTISNAVICVRPSDAGEATSEMVNTAIAGEAVQVTSVEYGGCALLENRSVKCFSAGSLPDWSGEFSNYDARDLKGVEELSLGSRRLCALKAAHEVVCIPIIPGGDEGSYIKEPLP